MKFLILTFLLVLVALVRADCENPNHWSCYSPPTSCGLPPPNPCDECQNQIPMSTITFSYQVPVPIPTVYPSYSPQSAPSNSPPAPHPIPRGQPGSAVEDDHPNRDFFVYGHDTENNNPYVTIRSMQLICSPILMDKDSLSENEESIALNNLINVFSDLDLDEPEYIFLVTNYYRNIIGVMNSGNGDQGVDKYRVCGVIKSTLRYNSDLRHIYGGHFSKFDIQEGEFALGWLASSYNINFHTFINKLYSFGEELIVNDNTLKRKLDGGRGFKFYCYGSGCADVALYVGFPLNKQIFQKILTRGRNVQLWLVLRP